jgi:UDP-2,4-diacetamido-2,4,6-trideoxy-beta-L-altropyranose hydrolase
MNQLFIRSDATISMGTGHIMRCIALAQAWKKRGGLVTFISHCPNPEISIRIESEGFEFIELEEICPSAYDIKKTLKILTNNIAQNRGKPGSPNWVILDGYHFTPEYQKAIIKEGFKLLVIDDYNHLDHYNADIILNQNIGSNHFHYSCKHDTKKLLGTDYVMLRSEFLMNKNIKPPLPSKAQNILVTMGGSDPDNMTLKILHAIDKIDDPDLNFKVIVGPDNPNMDTLLNASQNKPGKINLVTNANMPKMMAWADLCLTAGGSTCWELCFMKVPLMIITLAENQIELTTRLNKAGAAIMLGKKETLTSTDITHSILTLSGDKKKRIELKDAGEKLIDGKGTKRIIRQMLVKTVMLRSAGSTDAKLLYEWANDKKARLLSFNTDPIPWEEHQQWLKQKLKDNNTWIFIAENHLGSPIGQIRFDGKDDYYQISYSLDKKFRGLGLGKALLKTGLKTIQANIHKTARMQGSVKNDNVASKISFEKCGFSSIKNNSGITIGSDRVVYQLLLPPAKKLEKS